LQRISPVLLLEMQTRPRQLTRLPAQLVAGARLPAVRYQSGTVQFIVMFDPATGLPARIRTLDDDNSDGVSAFDVTFLDWRAVQGVKLAHQLVYTLNEKVVAQLQYNQVKLNPILAANLFDIPDVIKTTAAKAAPGEVPYQRVMRRQYRGGQSVHPERW
jgi:hypothetical protein